MEFDELWRKIEGLAGETFFQLGGKTFTYQADAAALTPSTTGEPIPRQAFEQIHALGEITSLRRLREMGFKDASLVFSILTDPRLKG